jgi:hypothetical protein
MTTSDDSVETTSAPPHRARSNTLTPGAPTSIAPVPGVLRAAAIASLGAGAIHATAAGAHSEPRTAAVAFALTAVLQIGWGALALWSGARLVGLAGVAVNGGALVGWALAKTSGIGFVDVLEAKEAVQFADAVAAGLAAIAIVGTLLALAGRVPWSTHPHPGLVGVAAVATVALVIPGMVKTGSHTHAGAHGDDAAGHDHGGSGAASQQPGVPYTATLPVDLGGVHGVSAQEQAEAEELVTVSLQTLPRFADIPSIEAMGYRSIGDAATGFEHFMNWPLINDGRVLDPDYPESLVFVVDPATGDKQLAAAMYMANADDTLETVPDLGGELVQWHIHNDLCFSGETNAWRVAGDTAPPPEECPPGTFRLSQVLAPMVHVWIIPHECGPFAALEGTGAGQIASGEERLCDHHHGAPA